MQIHPSLPPRCRIFRLRLIHTLCMHGNGVDKDGLVKGAFVIDEEEDDDGIDAGELDVDGLVEISESSDG